MISLRNFAQKPILLQTVMSLPAIVILLPTNRDFIEISLTAYLLEVLKQAHLSRKSNGTFRTIIRHIMNSDVIKVQAKDKSKWCFGSFYRLYELAVVIIS